MKVVAYCRYSSEMQRDSYSIEAQKRAIEEYCARENYELVRFYVDEAQSGTRDDREEFQNMIADSVAGEWQAVIVHKLDRFARDRYDSAIYKKKLKDNGVRVLSVTEPLDDSPESIMLESVLEGMAEYYSKNLAREVLKGKREAAQKGLFQGGRPPFGYDVKNQMYVINPDEAKIISEIFELLKQGYAPIEVIRHCYKKGYKIRTGRAITNYHLIQFVNNEKYAGVYIWRDIRVEDAVPAIVDKETFYYVRQSFIERKMRPSPRKNAHNYYILTGFIRCGYCKNYIAGNITVGSSLRKKPHLRYVRYRYPVYKCCKVDYSKGARRSVCRLKYVHKKPIEEFVIESIKQHILSDKGLKHIQKALRQQWEKRSQQNQKDVNKIKKQLDTLRNKKSRLLDLYLEHNIIKEDYLQKINELNRQIDNLQKNKSAINIDRIEITIEKIKTLIEKYSKTENSLDNLEFKRLLIKTFIKEVIVYNDKIEIYFNIPFTDDNNTPTIAFRDKQGFDPTNLTLYLNISRDILTALIPAKIPQPEICALL